MKPNLSISNFGGGIQILSVLAPVALASATSLGTTSAVASKRAYVIETMSMTNRRTQLTVRREIGAHS